MRKKTNYPLVILAFGIALAIAILTRTSKADSVDLGNGFAIERFRLTKIMLFEHSRVPLLTPVNTPTSRLDVDLDLSLMKNIVWRNTIRSYSVPKAMATVEWEYEIGLDMPEVWPIEIFYYHRSAHIFDVVGPLGTNWPLEDGVGIRINFVR